VRTPFLRKPRGSKLVMTIHDLVPLVVPQHHTVSYRVYFRRVLPYLVAQCDGVIAVSRATSDDIGRLLKPAQERLHVVPNAARWPCTPEDQILPKGPYLLAVGTVEPRKNLRRTVEAFLEAKRQLPDLPDRLLIAGGRGWGKSGIDRLLKDHEADVEWLGYVSDERLEDLYRRAKALVYPSLYEGFGLPVVEAMNLGCPVITSDRSSLPEVAGDAALCVDPESGAAIADAIRRLLTDAELRDELAVKGLRQASRFSWDRCAEETVAVYRQVVTGKRPAARDPAPPTPVMTPSTAALTID
jgi:glycosyltransferase involved in cell wall biosynthesis